MDPISNPANNGLIEGLSNVSRFYCTAWPMTSAKRSLLGDPCL